MKQKRQKWEKGKIRRETKDERKEREAMLSGEEKVNEKKWKQVHKRKKIRKTIVTLRKKQETGKRKNDEKEETRYRKERRKIK